MAFVSLAVRGRKRERKRKRKLLVKFVSCLCIKLTTFGQAIIKGNIRKLYSTLGSFLMKTQSNPLPLPLQAS